MKNSPKNLWKNNKYTFPSDADLASVFNFALKRRGFVYAIISPDAPQWGIKIGRTKNDPYKRVKQFQSEGVLYTYDVKTAFYFINSSWAEREAHKLLEHKKNNKEWFNCTDSEIFEVLNHLYDKEQRMLSKHFNVDILASGTSFEKFMESGWYPESFIY